MERAGVENSFREFFVDYVMLYPKDKNEWVSLLKRYHVLSTDDEILSFFNSPNFLERYVARQDGYRKESIFLDKAARARAWEKLRRQGVRDKLLSKDIALQERIDLMHEAELFIQSEIRKNRWLPIF